MRICRTFKIPWRLSAYRLSVAYTLTGDSICACWYGKLISIYIDIVYSSLIRVYTFTILFFFFFNFIGNLHGNTFIHRIKSYNFFQLFFFHLLTATRIITVFFSFSNHFRYRPAYKAFRNDSSFNFMVFFFIFFFQLLMMIYQTIGILGSGYCGFITAISQFDGQAAGILIGLLTLVIACSFGICAGGTFLLLTKVIFAILIYTKSKGHPVNNYLLHEHFVQGKAIVIVNGNFILLSQLYCL